MNGLMWADVQAGPRQAAGEGGHGRGGRYRVEFGRDQHDRNADGGDAIGPVVSGDGLERGCPGPAVSLPQAAPRIPDDRAVAAEFCGCEPPSERGVRVDRVAAAQRRGSRGEGGEWRVAAADERQSPDAARSQQRQVQRHLAAEGMTDHVHPVRGRPGSGSSPRSPAYHSSRPTEVHHGPLGKRSWTERPVVHAPAGQDFTRRAIASDASRTFSAAVSPPSAAASVTQCARWSSSGHSATDCSALVAADTWVRMSIQYLSSSTIRCRPRTWPSIRRSRVRYCSFVLGIYRTSLVVVGVHSPISLGGWIS
jgi:hypothetical protein